MRSVNLIPMRRRLAASRRRRVRLWCCVVVLYALLLAAMYGGTYIAWAPDRAGLSGQLTRVAERINQANLALNALRPQLIRAQTIVKATAEVADQPDWSTLLALMASLRGEEVVLKSCALTPIHASQNTATPPIAYKLTLSGYGLTQTEVARFVLRLEQVNLFSQIKLLETKTEPFFNERVFAFQVEATLETIGGAAP